MLQGGRIGVFKRLMHYDSLSFNVKSYSGKLGSLVEDD